MLRIAHIFITIVAVCSLSQCTINDNRQEVEIPLDKICVGDIAFRRGEGFTSNIVAYKDADGKYSHVGVIAQSDSGLVVVHAVPGDHPTQGGYDIVRAESLSEYFARNNAGKGAIMRIALDSTQQAVINNLALKKAMQQVEFDHQYNLDDTTKLYCTELLQHIFKAAGIDLAQGRITTINAPGMSNNYIMPSDIHHNPDLKTIFIY